MTNIPNDQFAPSTRSRVDESPAGGGWAAFRDSPPEARVIKENSALVIGNSLVIGSLRHWSFGGDPLKMSKNRIYWRRKVRQHRTEKWQGFARPLRFSDLRRPRSSRGQTLS